MDWRNGFLPPVSGKFVRARLIEMLSGLEASAALSLRTAEQGNGVIRFALSYRYQSKLLLLTDSQIEATADVIEEVERKWGHGKYQLWMDQVMLAGTRSTDRSSWIGEGIEAYTRCPVLCIAESISSRYSYTGGSSRGWISIERFAGCKGRGLLSSASAYAGGDLDLRNGKQLSHSEVRERLKAELPNLLESVPEDGFSDRSDRSALLTYSRTRRGPVIGDGDNSAVTGSDASLDLLDPMEVYATLVGGVLPPIPNPSAFLGSCVSQVQEHVFGVVVDKRSGVAMVASPVIAGVRVAVCRGTVPVTPSTVRASDPTLSSRVGFGTADTVSSVPLPDEAREGICSYIRENCGEDYIHWIAPYDLGSSKVYVVEVCKAGAGQKLTKARAFGVSGYTSEKILVNLPASARTVLAQRLVYEAGSLPRPLCGDILRRSAGFFRDTPSPPDRYVDPSVVVVMSRAKEVMRHEHTEGRELLAALTCAVRVEACSAGPVVEQPSGAFRVVDTVPYQVVWPSVSLASALVVLVSVAVLMWSGFGTVSVVEWSGLLSALVALAFPAVGVTHRCYYGKWDIFDGFIGRREVTPSTRLSRPQEWDLLKTVVEANAASEVYTAERNCYLGRARGSRAGLGPLKMSELWKLGYILGLSKKGCYILQPPSGPNLKLTGSTDLLHATEDEGESLYLALRDFPEGTKIGM